MSSYRPNYQRDLYDLPSSRQDMRPSPRGPPPGSGMYQFGADTWRPHNSNTQRANDFSFRYNRVAPQYPQSSDFHPPIYNTHDRVPTGPRSMRDNVGNGRDVRPRLARGGGQRVPTASRPLLKFQRGNTPEQMLGMINDPSAEKRYMNTEDLSDSTEEAMDESDADQHEPDSGVPVLHDGNPSTVNADNVVASHFGMSSKESLNGDSKGKSLDPVVPKWSNPECYTALPPPDESQRKRKDVVKLIRKSRVASQVESNPESQVATNDDFISFNFGDALGPIDDDNNSASDVATQELQGRSVHVQPSTFSHLKNFNSREVDRPPGTDKTYLSSYNLVPPPQPSASVLSKPVPALEVLDDSRKRKRAQEDHSEDETLIPRPPKRKKVFGKFSNGTLAPEWVPLKSQNPVPWVDHPINFEGQAGFRLHKEICDFYDFVKPQTYEQVIREDLLQRLRNAIQEFDPTCELHCFGSFAAGLYLPNADMDLVMISQAFRRTGKPHVCQNQHKMDRLGQHLRKCGIADPSSIDIVAFAKVPIIKFVDMATSLRVDLSFENTTGLIANDTFSAWRETFPAMPIIVMVIKQFLMMRELNEVINGGLGGFSVTCLVTSLLQNMPQVQTGKLKPEQHLGEILLEFLDLYGNQLDISRVGLSMEPPGYIDKQLKLTYGQRCRPDRLAIIDPNKPDNDISGGSKNVVLIFKKFSRAREEILSAMIDSTPRSMLGWMLGGNYNNFLWQRQRLRRLYKENYGSIPPGYPRSDRELVDISLKDMSIEQHDVDKFSTIPSGLEDFVIRSQHFLAEARSSEASLPTRLPVQQVPTNVQRSSVEDGLSNGTETKRKALLISEKVSAIRSLRAKLGRIKQACKLPGTQKSVISKSIKHQRARFNKELAILQAELSKLENPETTRIAKPIIPLMKGMKLSPEQQRSESFKLNHPEIAAIVAVPDYLTKEKQYQLIAQHKKSKSKQEPGTVKPTSTFDLASGERLQQDQEAAFALMALRNDTGDRMDNPIPID